MAAAKPARSAASFVDIQRPLDLPSLPSQAVPFRSPAKAVDGTVPEFPSTYVPSESRATRTESARRVPSRPTAATDNNEYRYASIDRKSTRLNSSHANISYAVF